jgi:hypothetical protein
MYGNSRERRDIAELTDGSGIVGRTARVMDGPSPGVPPERQVDVPPARAGIDMAGPLATYCYDDHK